MEDNEGGFDEWRAMISSPKFVSMEEFTSKPNPIFQSPLLEADKLIDPYHLPLRNNNNNEEINLIVYDYYNNNNCPDEEEEEEEELSRGGNLWLQRRAKAGDVGSNNTPIINTEWGGLEGCYHVASPAAPWPYITIQPGISPIALLLDTSILLPNS
ncbi:Vacuolar membrane-associated protein [Actinidia chinensis var. chinensis]|uniref:Vacuolar membrane-associated protein n=1 Tax=Actinidia chinensis var. chinensis TaxID=1590841 RepID=A0A2R6PWB6_ACTCC|nr:Vacuolar membrane-associated protein [Actinidia chinensis var. chinensis]